MIQITFCEDEFDLDLGMICGRFQHVHKGHQFNFDTAYRFCKRLLIMFGSSQESGTPRNPFSLETRMRLVSKIYQELIDNGTMILGALPDLSANPEVDVDANWGRFVLDNAIKYGGKKPDLMIYGNDEIRSKWFDREDIDDVTQIVLPRTKILTSATAQRKLIVLNKKEEWKAFSDPKIWDEFDLLREELLAIPEYKEMIK